MKRAQGVDASFDTVKHINFKNQPFTHNKHPTMSIRIPSKVSDEGKDNELLDTDDSSKGSTSCGDGNNVARSSIPKSTSVLMDSKKRINEAFLSADEAERLQAKRAYNRECASRARQRGKELIAQLEKQVKDLHDDKSELRRTLAAMEKRLKQLQKENELLLGRNAISSYDAVMAGTMIENGAIQIPPTQFPFASGIRSSNLNATTMAMNGVHHMGYNHFY